MRIAPGAAFWNLKSARASSSKMRPSRATRLIPLASLSASTRPNANAKLNEQRDYLSLIDRMDLALA